MDAVPESKTHMNPFLIFSKNKSYHSAYKGKENILINDSEK